jgi:outer membrane protein assembly factor BamB/tetratricopeptide (TPR) repeat protein
VARPGYDVFISYHRATDAQLAASLKSVLQRLGKPWYRRKAMEVFLDDTDMSANPGLWPTILGAIDCTRYLLLLASPGAAQSDGVGREVEHFLKSSSAEKLLIAHTDGTIQGAAPDAEGDPIDWTTTDALPDGLEGVFEEEPLWIDLRWVREVDAIEQRNPRLQADASRIAAPVHGTTPEELTSQHLKQHRRTLATAWAGAVILALFAVLAGWSYLRSEDARRGEAAQRIVAEENLAVSRRALAGTQFEKAQRAAGEGKYAEALMLSGLAHETDPATVPLRHVVEARFRGMRNVWTSPAAFDGLRHVHSITDDGRTVLGAIAPFQVGVWNLVDGRLAAQLALDRGRPGAVAIASDRAWLAVAGGGEVRFEPLEGTAPDTVISFEAPWLRVAPGNRWIVASDDVGRLFVLDVRSGSVRRVAKASLDAEVADGFVDDGVAFLLVSREGAVTRIDLASAYGERSTAALGSDVAARVDAGFHVPRVVLARDGATAASLAMPMEAVVWDPKTGHAIARVEFDTTEGVRWNQAEGITAEGLWGAELESWAFSADGETLVAALEGGLVRGFDARTGTHQWTQRLHPHMVRPGAAADVLSLWSLPGSSRIAVVSEQVGGEPASTELQNAAARAQRIRLLDARDGRQVDADAGYTAAIPTAVALDEARGELAYADSRGAIRVVDASTGGVKAAWQVPARWVLALAYRGATGELVSAGIDGIVRTWKQGHEWPVREQKVAELPITSLDVSADGTRAVVGLSFYFVPFAGEGLDTESVGTGAIAQRRSNAAPSAVAILRLEAEGPPAWLSAQWGLHADIRSVAMLPDGSRCAAVYADGVSNSLVTWSSGSPTAPRAFDLDHATDSPTVVCYDPTGRHLVVGTGLGRVLVLDAATLDVLAQRRVGDSQVAALDMSADGTVLGVAMGEAPCQAFDASMRTYEASYLVDAETLEPMGVVKGTGAGSHAIAVGWSGRIAVTADHDHAVRMWARQAGRVYQRAVRPGPSATHAESGLAVTYYRFDEDEDYVDEGEIRVEPLDPTRKAFAVPFRRRRKLDLDLGLSSPRFSRSGELIGVPVSEAPPDDEGFEPDAWFLLVHATDGGRKVGRIALAQPDPNRDTAVSDFEFASDDSCVGVLFEMREDSGAEAAELVLYELDDGARRISVRFPEPVLLSGIGIEGGFGYGIGPSALWRWEADGHVSKLPPLPDNRSLSGVALSSDGSTLVLCDVKGGLHLLDAQTGDYVRESARLPEPARILLVDASGTRAVVCTLSRVTLVDLVRNHVVWTAPTDFMPMDASLSGDGERLIVVGSRLRAQGFPESIVAEWQLDAIGSFSDAIADAPPAMIRQVARVAALWPHRSLAPRGEAVLAGEAGELLASLRELERSGHARVLSTKGSALGRLSGRDADQDERVSQIRRRLLRGDVLSAEDRRDLTAKLARLEPHDVLNWTGLVQAEEAVTGPEGALEVAREALTRFPEPTDAAKIEALMAGMLTRLGRQDEALATFERALPHLRDQLEITFARWGMSQALDLFGRYEDALTVLLPVKLGQSGDPLYGQVHRNIAQFREVLESRARAKARAPWWPAVFAIHVVPDSSAEALGIEVDDILLSIDGTPADAMNESTRLASLRTGNLGPSGTTTLEFLRGNETVKLVARSAVDGVIWNTVSGDVRALPAIQQFGANSPASYAGLMQRDVVLSVAGIPAPTVGALIDALAMQSADVAYEIRVRRYAMAPTGGLVRIEERGDDGVVRARWKYEDLPPMQVTGVPLGIYPVVWFQHQPSVRARR